MELVNINAWPSGPKLVLQLAQQRADEHQHAAVSGAHVASVVLDMHPVRRQIGDAAELASLDAAVERGLLLAQKGRGMGATFVGVLAQAISGGRPWTTADLLRAAIGEGAGLAKLRPVMETQAPTVAALLDARLVGELVSAPLSPPMVQACGNLALGLSDASRRKHRYGTTRHVLAGALRTYQSILAKRGLLDLGDAPARLDQLLESEPRATEDAIRFSPRLVGAIAGAVMRNETPLSLALLSECVRGDEAVAFVREVLSDAIARIAGATDAASAAVERAGAEPKETDPPTSPREH